MKNTVKRKETEKSKRKYKSRKNISWIKVTLVFREKYLIEGEWWNITKPGMIILQNLQGKIYKCSAN